MKVLKIIVPVILVGMLGIATVSAVTGAAAEHQEYQEHLAFAKESSQKGLYEQAIEEYKAALTYQKEESIYQNIKDTYALLYAEDPSVYVQSCYLEDMADATADFPKTPGFWKIQLDLYMEDLDYKKAYTVAKNAMKVPVEDEEIEKIYEELLYMVKTDYELYSDFKTCLNGYISAYDGNQWHVLDEGGEELTGGYEFIGLINDEGKGIYRNDIAVWLLDKNEVARGRFDLEIEDAGYYSASLDMVPVKIGGVWKYLKGDGSFLPGEFETAGSFYNGKAAVQKDSVWYLIDAEGKPVSEKRYEDIKLDLYGCHLQGDVILAKENGKYHIYDADFQQIGDFSCDDIDICIGNGAIAFCKNGKWGYVGADAEVVVEPSYAKAKSFSNSMAAVCNQDGDWGFINSKYKLVIDYVYLDAFYYTSQETCLVSLTENNYQFQHYQFD